jgi:tRNA wybutosine-synthesizing protein 1
MDRWQEAHTVRHCALSLVGEPIMYPRIGELLGDLHRRKISTFLVTNGQHPHAIGTLRPITQLYVSVDAPTQESLIEIDRPLFNDAWDRLKQSLVSLKDKGQRTVARLTVVKGWNSDEIEGYAKLIVLGQVSLVEVKGVTFCGKSDASNLNMTNSPWHHEVVELTRTLKDEIQKIRDKGGDDVPPEYGLACEHKHSCSVLLARVDHFSKVDPATGQRKWQTWIDYDRFQELAAMYEEDPTFTFGVEDYVADTPAWALFGAEEEGFDPTDKRHRRPKKHPKYTRYDEHGVPTHDDNDEALSLKERGRLSKLMDERLQQIGTGTVVTELKGGAKEVVDASLMFRGMVVAK